MSFSESFTHEEQLQLSSLPTLVGSAMTFAGGSGLGTVKEMIANSKALIEGGKTYASNSIISAIMPVMTNMQEGMNHAKEFKAKVQEHVQPLGIKSTEDLRSAALEEARKVNALLTLKATPEEATQYKHWILNIAEEISKAAKEGGFLGFGGERVSTNEKALFEEIAGALQPLGAK